MHVRCATHILNLIVKEGLKEIDDSIIAFRNAIQYVRSSTNRLKSFEFWVETGKMTRESLPLDVNQMELDISHVRPSFEVPASI